MVKMESKMLDKKSPVASSDRRPLPESIRWLAGATLRRMEKGLKGEAWNASYRQDIEYCKALHHRRLTEFGGLYAWMENIHPAEDRFERPDWW
jgi:hypothetical protein